MRTSTRLAWPILNEPILEPKSFPVEDKTLSIEVPTKKLVEPIMDEDDVSTKKDYIVTIRLKPEHIWIGFLCLLIGFLWYSLSLSWSKIALLQDALSMK